MATATTPDGTSSVTADANQVERAVARALGAGGSLRSNVRTLVRDVAGTALEVAEGLELDVRDSWAAGESRAEIEDQVANLLSEWAYQLVKASLAAERQAAGVIDLVDGAMRLANRRSEA